MGTEALGAEGVTIGVGVTDGGTVTDVVGNTEVGTARELGGAVINVGGGGPMEVGVIAK